MEEATEAPRLDADLVIAGGGHVGLSLALALRQAATPAGADNTTKGVL